MDAGGRATHEAKAEGLGERINHCFFTLSPALSLKGDGVLDNLFQRGTEGDKEGVSGC